MSDSIPTGGTKKILPEMQGILARMSVDPRSGAQMALRAVARRPGAPERDELARALGLAMLDRGLTVGRMAPLAKAMPLMGPVWDELGAESALALFDAALVAGAQRGAWFAVSLPSSLRWGALGARCWRGGTLSAERALAALRNPSAELWARARGSMPEDPELARSTVRRALSEVSSWRPPGAAWSQAERVFDWAQSIRISSKQAGGGESFAQRGEWAEWASSVFALGLGPRAAQASLAGLGAADAELCRSLLPGLAAAAARTRMKIERNGFFLGAPMAPSASWRALLSRPEWDPAELLEARAVLAKSACQVRDEGGLLLALPQGPSCSDLERLVHASFDAAAASRISRKWLSLASSPARLPARGSARI